ncbi:unnamed protein product, partial [Brenthis ino]
MFARVLFVAVLYELQFECTIIKFKEPEIISNTKIELKPVHISTRLNDIVILTAPIINNQTIYYLSKPNGDVTKLNLNINATAYYESNVYDVIVVIMKRRLQSIITSVNEYSLFNLNTECCTDKDIFAEKERELKANDFMIGPLIGDDHGNWALSAYFKNFDEWIEVFQVITIEIIEPLSTEPAKPTLRPGETFNLRFAYAIKDLQSCEIVAPRSTFDRFYDRNMEFSDFCSFRIPNVTKHDAGLWRIIGVGRIVRKFVERENKRK